MVEDKEMLNAGLYYAVVVVILTTFALLAFMFKRSLVDTLNKSSIEFFITARKTQGTWRIGWSFFAGAMGSWVVMGPPNYACYAGILGLFMYGLSSGLPILVICIFGDRVQEKWPNCTCLGDFINWRFGPKFRVFVVGILLFNMSLAMAAEFTAIGTLFKDHVHSSNYPIIIIIGLLTTSYTAYGGLEISIITDQFQALTSIVLIVCLGIYLAAFFRPLQPLEGWNTEVLGPNSAGYASIFVMPVCLMASTVFSEAIWQRVWAAESQRALHVGGFIGFTSVTLAVLFFGTCGLLAAWAGLIVFDPAKGHVTNPNLYLFQVFKASQLDAHNDFDAVGLTIVVLASVMSMGAVDSLQNGLTATISAQFLGSRSVWPARAAVVLISVPIMLISALDLQVLMLLLIPNMLCTCCFLPILLGAWDTPVGRDVISEGSALFSCASAALLTTLYGIARAGAVWEGVVLAWYGNGYSVDFFGVAACSSLLSLAAFVGIRRVMAAVSLSCGQLSKEGGVGGVQRGLRGVWLASYHSERSVSSRRSSKEVVLVSADHQHGVQDGIPFLEIE